MLCFIITRHVISEETNKYWNECYRCIRKFYPDNMIMIIDDESDYTFVKFENNMKNIMIVQSEFPHAAEILGYYYFYRYRLADKAVILHDSVFFQEYVDLESHNDIKYLWHFVKHSSDDVKQEVNLIETLDNHTELLSFYYKKHLWHGCFGSQSVIALSFLDHLQDKYKIFRIIPLVKDRIIRYALERVLACIFTFEHRTLFDNPSICGNIYDWINWGFTFQRYEEFHRSHYRSIVKVWTCR